MDRRADVRFGLTALAAIIWFVVQPCLGQDSETDPVVKSVKNTYGRDPVAAAFAIPYGTVFNEKQRSEYERLKTDNESALRQTTSALAAATTSAEKADLRREISMLQREIRVGMQQIVMMPHYEALQARQKQVLEQGYDLNGQAGYYGSSYAAVPGWYGLYYSPLYGYPLYGVWYHHGWHNPNYRHGRQHYGQGNAQVGQQAGYSVIKPAGQRVGKKVGSPVVTHKTTAPVKAGAVQVARHVTVGNPPKSMPSARSAPRPAHQAKPQNHPAKHH